MFFLSCVKFFRAVSSIWNVRVYLLTTGNFASQKDVFCWLLRDLNFRINLVPMGFVKSDVAFPESYNYCCSLGTLEKPASCPGPIQCLMDRCWSYLPEERPTFLECLSTIQELMLVHGNQQEWERNR